MRLGFHCASASQQYRVTAALRKALERQAVEHNLFPSDNKQRESILEAAYSIRCHFENHNLESTGGFVGIVDVDFEGAILMDPLMVYCGSPGDVELRDEQSGFLLDPGALLVARERLEFAPVVFFSFVGHG